MAKSSASTRILLVLLATLVLVALISLYRRQRAEGFNAALTPSAAAAPEPMPAFSGSAAPFGSGAADALAPPPAGVEALSTEQYRDAPGSCATGGGGGACASPADRLKAEDLLPKDAANSKWAQVNPAGQGDVQNRNFLTAGYHLGVDTQGASLRNASHDLRSTPAAPRIRVSIWNQSDIEPDMSRRPLE